MILCVPRCAWLIAGCLALVGCGGSAKTLEISGEVAFKGKPVPAGRIYFDADVTKSNDGPQGYAEIVDGKFDTSKGGKGPCGGPTVVVIHGYEVGNEAGAVGNRLFPEFKIAIDLPLESSQRNFDVPAAAASKQSTPPTGGKI